MTSHSDPMWVRTLNNRLPDGSEYNFGPWITAERASMEDGTPGAIFIPAQTKGARNIVAALSPIAITRKYKNLQRGLESVEISWGNRLQHSTIVDRGTIANASKITQLASYGAPVDSNHARNLVDFFSEFQLYNEDVLPVQLSSEKLGWIKSETCADGFVPYDEITFVRPEDVGAKDLLNAVHQKGAFESWLELTSTLRNVSSIARIILAASLASVLVGRCETLPFAVCTWGPSGVGKSVLLALAASVWANPSMSGGFLKSANATTAGLCEMADMLNNLPLCCDELQTIKSQEKYSGYDKLIYSICEGLGRTRLTSNATMQKSGTWKNIAILNGEEPVINDATSDEGAKNRVIEIHIADALFAGSEGGKVVRTIMQNYGHAGRTFVNYIKAQDIAHITNLHDSLTDDVQRQTTATSKQAQNAALILLADRLARECIWVNSEDSELTIDDLAPFLVTQKSVNKADEAFQLAVSIINTYQANFIDVHGTKPISGKLWGRLIAADDKERSENVASKADVNRTMLEEELAKSGVSFKAHAKAWEQRGYIESFCEGKTKRFDRRIQVGSTCPRCVRIILPKTQQ